MQIQGFHGTYVSPYVVSDVLTEHVHRGRGFEISTVGTLTLGGSITLLGVVGDIPVHFHGFVLNTSAGPVTTTLIESPTVSVQGSVVPAINKNRILNSASTMTTYTGATISGGTVLGTREIPEVGGGAHTEGGNAGFITEWVLKPNTTYAIKFTAGAALTYSAIMSWYELVLH